jgi:hypothetical protein
VRSIRASCSGINRRIVDASDALLSFRAHSEALMRRLLHTLASLSFAVSLVLLGFTLNDLATGLAELPQHWWSSGAAASVIACGCAALLTRNRPRREAQ